MIRKKQVTFENQNFDCELDENISSNKSKYYRNEENKIENLTSDKQIE